MLKKSLGILLLAASTPAMADISYSYIDVSVMRIDIDDVFFVGGDVEGEIIGIEGSFEVAEDWFLRAAFAQGNLDFGFDLDSAELGVGYKLDITERSDVFATVSYFRSETSSAFGSGEADGLGISAGFRAMLGDRFELNGALSHVDFDDGGDNLFVSAGGLYSFTEQFALGFDIERDPDAVSYGIVGRYYFGN